MKKNFKVKQLFNAIDSLIIISILTIGYTFVWYNYYNSAMLKQFQFQKRGNWLTVALYVVILIIFSNVFGALKVGYLKKMNILYSQILTILAVNVITYVQISLIARKLVNPNPLLVLTAADFVAVAIWTFIASYIYSKLYPPRKLVIIYGSTLATELVYKMSTRYDKYTICYSINIDSGLEAILEAIPSFEGVIICDVPSKIRNDILKFCYENSIRTYVTPKISDIIIRSAENIDLFDTPILLCRNTGLNDWQRLIKRACDILLSLVAIVIFSPFMLIIAAAIKLYDRGPVFYKQKRATIDGKEFDILKFRSMIVDAEKDNASVPCTEHDPRITPVGRFIRAIRMDEIPQLINILKGDMSVVGPRPERVEHVEEYSKEIPEFKYRLKVKGGLTGYAQVYGKYNTTAYDKLRLDLMYIQNYSLLLDVKLILATIKILFIKESTEGFDETISQNITESSKNHIETTDSEETDKDAIINK